MGDPGPSNAPPPGLEDDEDDNLDETAALQIESDLASSANKGRGGLASRLFGRKGSPKRYGSMRDGAAGTSGGVVGRAKDLVTSCAGRLGNLVSGGALGATETEEEPLLFALTWAQPQRYGIAQCHARSWMQLGDVSRCALACDLSGRRCVGLPEPASCTRGASAVPARGSAHA